MTQEDWDKMTKPSQPVYFKRCIHCKEYLYRGMCKNLECKDYSHRELMQTAEIEATEPIEKDSECQQAGESPATLIKEPTAAGVEAFSKVIIKSCENCKHWWADYDFQYASGTCSEIHNHLLYPVKPPDD